MDKKRLFILFYKLVKKRQLFRLKSVSLQSEEKHPHLIFSLFCVNVTYKTTEAELALPLHYQPSDIKHPFTLLPPPARSLLDHSVVRLQSSGLRRTLISGMATHFGSGCVQETLLQPGKQEPSSNQSWRRLSVLLLELRTTCRAATPTNRAQTFFWDDRHKIFRYFSFFFKSWLLLFVLCFFWIKRFMIMWLRREETKEDVVLLFAALWSTASINY